MALLKLDSKSLSLNLLVGVNEEYKPRKDIIDLSSKIDDLKTETNKFISDNWGEKSVTDLNDLFKKNEEEKKKWLNFLENVYNPKLQKLLTTIDIINKDICPNYGEINGGKLNE